MKNYIVIVRDFSPYRSQPSDIALEMFGNYYKSPIVSLDWEGNRDKAIDEFDEKYRKYFSHFLHVNYELVEV